MVFFFVSWLAITMLGRMIRRLWPLTLLGLGLLGSATLQEQLSLTEAIGSLVLYGVLPAYVILFVLQLFSDKYWVKKLLNPFQPEHKRR